MSGFNRGGWESARIAVDSSGRATIFSGSMSQGHGHVTSLSQIAADVLQIPIEHIDVVQGDTRQVQAGHGTFNSRSMSVGGSSVHVSSHRIVSKAKKIAAGLLEVDEKDVAYEGGRFSVPGTDIPPVTFGAVARMAYVGHKLPDGIAPGLDETVFYDPTGMGAPSGIHMAYVDVDPDTGIVEILDYVAVDDVGTLINPLLAAGQIHGGVVQGIGQALYEGVSYDPDNGQLMTGSLLDYAVPRAEHMPNIRASFQQTPSPTNPIGVKGIGESGSIAAPPTMVHAVLDALAPFGITHIDMPMTPPRIWSAIQIRPFRSKSMIPAAFDYVRATSLAQAIGMLAERSRRHQAGGRWPHADPDAETAFGITDGAGRHPRYRRPQRHRDQQRPHPDRRADHPCRTAGVGAAASRCCRSFDRPPM